MAKENTETKTISKEDELLYTDGEVSNIMVTLSRVYALDDAIYNQEQLRRPETYIQPLREIRKNISEHLVAITAKGDSEEKPAE